ncbi:MAG: PspC domain-containing protein [Chitinophagaceae bacterium]|nr:PspC domain-containing protein [Flavisolibacter sp.]
MKKIININLSGRVIPIEDAAYENLQQYIDSLRRYFANEEGRDEIINDIESRIAELMSEVSKKDNTPVTESDMEAIINSMGRIEDFAEVDAADTIPGGQHTASAEYAQTEKKRFKGRLYRDRTDKILGGVCAGIANYLNVDPAIIRLLFAIITFGGFGFGILIYIVLWIVLPPRDLEDFVGKRLFRNPEDRIIGGVAGGLGAYFNKEAWMIRLIFVAPLILNIFLSIINGIFGNFGRHYGPDLFFGSFTGTFILAYIILWIVLPEAKSPFQKMEMRGEKVDVNRIRQNVKEGMTDFKGRMQEWGEEVKTSAQQFGDRASEFANTRGKTFATEAAQAARPVANGIGHAIGVLFKAFFLFIAGSIAFALFVAMIVLIFGGGTAIWPLKESFLGFVLDGFWQKLFFWGTVIFFFLTPLVAFITWLVRRMLRVRTQRHYLGYIFGGLWIVGIFCLITLISSLVRDTRRVGTVTEQVAMAQPQNSRLIVNVNEPEIRFSGDLWFIDDSDTGWDLSEDSLHYSDVRFRVTKSVDSNYSVIVHKYSRGSNRTSAMRRAEKISFNVSSTDSILNLGSGLAIDQTSKFRGQRVVVEIKVPVGKRIMFDESVENRINPGRIRVGVNKDRRDRRNRRDRGWDYEWDSDNNFFNWKTGITYVMSATGQLVDETSPVSTEPAATDTYEYRGSGDDLNKEIEDQRRKTQEEERKLRELEQRRNEGTTIIETPVKKKFTTSGISSSFITSPVLSLVI